MLLEFIFPVTEPLAATVPEEEVPYTLTKDLLISTAVIVTLPELPAEPRCTDLIPPPALGAGNTEVPIRTSSFL
jgi:hypothetical protein